MLPAGVTFSGWSGWIRLPSIQVPFVEQRSTTSTSRPVTRSHACLRETVAVLTFTMCGKAPPGSPRVTRRPPATGMLRPSARTRLQEMASRLRFGGSRALVRGARPGQRTAAQKAGFRVVRHRTAAAVATARFSRRRVGQTGFVSRFRRRRIRIRRVGFLAVGRSTQRTARAKRLIAKLASRQIPRVGNLVHVSAFAALYVTHSCLHRPSPGGPLAVFWFQSDPGRGLRHRSARAPPPTLLSASVVAAPPIRPP